VQSESSSRKRGREKPIVLVVDDEASARELLCNYLETEGYTVMVAASGTAAVESARNALPDLIVMDVLMPGPGGLQTLFVLKENPKTAKIPIIVVSGMDPKFLGSTVGVSAYLVKPVDRSIFIRSVHKLLALPNSQE
jgi:CheY-like chemotaxis protein